MGFIKCTAGALLDLSPDSINRSDEELQKKPEILILAGSIRTGSFSQRFADAYAGNLVNHECVITRVTLSDYPLPMMNEDLEKESGVPENAIKLARLFHQHDGVVMVTPEYNGSFPPLLKNTIDWVSRVSSYNGKPVIPYRNKICAIAASSPGAMGGISSLAHLRDVLVRLGMLVISEQMALGNAAKAFDHMDKLTNERSAAMLESACTSLVEKARLLS